jgi:predicted nucleic acid-binding protein
MKYHYVLDCSVTMAWFFGDDITQATDKLKDDLGEGAVVVPMIWALEVANVLWLLERKQRIKAYHSEKVQNIIELLPIETDAEPRAMGRLLGLAREYEITIYDAAYLELSLRHGIPLATVDKKLMGAAISAGIPILPKILI